MRGLKCRFAEICRCLRFIFRRLLLHRHRCQFLFVVHCVLYNIDSIDIDSLAGTQMTDTQTILCIPNRHSNTHNQWVKDVKTVCTSIILIVLNDYAAFVHSVLMLFVYLIVLATVTFYTRTYSVRVVSSWSR